MRKAIREKDWDSIPGYLTIKKAISSWSEGEFTLKNNTIQYQGKEIPQTISQRIMAMIQRGENYKPVCLFFERLSRNPSMRSVEQLFTFLQHCNIPLTEDGCFLAYKGVTEGLKDEHSGKWDNSPGATNRMPRNHISDDPQRACHDGFHVGALNYAKGFGHRLVVCKVDPENVVSVPYDSVSEKMRVCEYEVIGHYTTSLPSTTIPSRDIPVLQKQWLVQSSKDGKTPRKREKKAVEHSVINRPTPTERKRFYRFNKKGAENLLKQNIYDLRRYATCHLGIVGASKILGGKTALVATICAIRGK